MRPISSAALSCLVFTVGIGMIPRAALAQIAPASAPPAAANQNAPTTSQGVAGELKPGWKVYVVRLIPPAAGMTPGPNGYKLGAPEFSFVQPADQANVYERAMKAPLQGKAYGIVLKGLLNVPESGTYPIVTTVPAGPDVVCQEKIAINGEPVLSTKHGHWLQREAFIHEVSAKLEAGQTPIEIFLGCAYERTGDGNSIPLLSKVQLRITMKSPSGDLLEPLRAEQIVHSNAIRYE